MVDKICKSITTSEPCTPAQYIAEFLCIREAHLKGKDLPIRFWQLPEWKKRFIKSVVWANRALTQYSFESIMGVFKDKRFDKRYDLANKSILKEIAKKELQLNSRLAQPVETREIDGSQKPLYGTSLRDRLL